MIRYALLGTAAIFLLTSSARAQSLKFEAPSDAAGLGAKIPALAEAALAQYREADERKRLDTLFRLQIAAGHWADAENTLADLHAHFAAAGDPQGRATDVQYQILVRAKLIQANEGLPVETAFARAFHAIMDPMDNRAAALVAHAEGLAVESAIGGDNANGGADHAEGLHGGLDRLVEVRGLRRVGPQRRLHQRSARGRRAGWWLRWCT